MQLGPLPACAVPWGSRIGASIDPFHTMGQISKGSAPTVGAGTQGFLNMSAPIRPAEQVPQISSPAPKRVTFGEHLVTQGAFGKQVPSTVGSWALWEKG